MKKDETTNQAGIPLQERSPDDLNKLFARDDEYIRKQFLALHAYAVEKHVGIFKLANQTSISNSILSPCFNHTYTGDYFAVAERVEKFFWRLGQKELYGGLRDFIETRSTKILWQVFEKTRIIRRIQVIQSPEQLRKSTTAIEYVRRNNSGRTIHVTVPGGTRHGCNDFIWALADQLGIPYSIKFREKRIRIREKLEACDLMIIDQAHQIFTWSPASIRDFFDYIITDIHNNGERGIVLLITNDDMISRLAKFKKEAGYNIGQILGRMRHDIIHLDPIKDIFEDDIKTIISHYYTAPSAAVIKKIHKLAQQEQMGHFGLVFDILNESWTHAKARNKPLSDEIVIATADEIVAEQKDHKQLYE